MCHSIFGKSVFFRFLSGSKPGKPRHFREMHLQIFDGLLGSLYYAHVCMAHATYLVVLMRVTPVLIILS